MIGMNMEISTYETHVNFGGRVDRRGTSRFPVQEEIRYRVLHAKGAPTNGVGTTLDIGSGGILFTTEDRLPMGRLVEVSVNWPVRLGGSCRLQFVAVGKVVRSEAGKAAVRIERYQFKTRGAAVMALAATG